MLMILKYAAFFISLFSYVLRIYGPRIFGANWYRSFAMPIDSVHIRSNEMGDLGCQQLLLNRPTTL